MKFSLVDRIVSIEPSERIVTVKALSLAEEYLADHFPTFPVLPGVLMIESAVQAAAWLVRVEQDFAKSVVGLASARNVKYASFVRPGDSLRCQIEAVSIDEQGAEVKAAGFIDDRKAVSARLKLRSFNLADRAAHLAEADERIVADLRKAFALAGGPEALAAAAR